MKLNVNEFYANEIDKLEVNCKIFQIRLVGSLSDKIEFSWKDTATRRLEIKRDGNLLKVVDHMATTVYGTLALINLKKDAQLLIKIPENYSGKLILQNKDNPIHLTDVSIFGDIGIANKAGDILLENVSANLIDIRGNHGKVKCYEIKADSMIDISTESGAITCSINDLQENYSIFCDTKNRRTDCPRGTENAPKKLRVSSKIGLITVNFQNSVTGSKTMGRCNSRNAFHNW